MKKFNYVVAFLVLSGVVVAADTPKVSPEISVRIRNIQHDQDKISSQMLTMQIQYQQMQASFTHDAGELDTIKKEALSDAKLDPEKFDLDLEKLQFVAKPKEEKK